MEEKSEVLYNSLSEGGGYTKSFEEFKAQFSNEETVGLLYSSLNESGKYTKTVEEFTEQFFPTLKKKDNSQSTSAEEVMVSDTPVVEEPGSLEPSDQEDSLKAPTLQEIEDSTNKGEQSMWNKGPDGELLDEGYKMNDLGEVVWVGAGPDPSNPEEVVDTTRTLDLDFVPTENTNTTNEDSGEDNTMLEDVAGKWFLTDFIGDMYRSGKKGFVQGNTADEGWELMYKGGDSSPEDILEFLQAQEGIAALGESDEMKEFNKVYEEAGGGTLGFLKGLAYAGPLSIISQLGAETVTQMVNKSSAVGAGAAIGTGAGIGALAGGVGAIPGALAALPAAYAASGAALETGLAFAEFLREAVEKNGDSFNQEGIRKVLNDDDAMLKIRARSAGRGAIIGVVDGFTLKLGGKVIAKQVIKGAGKGKRALTAMAIESGGGGVGETLARLGVGQELDARDIGFETIGNLGGSGTAYAYGSLLAKPVYKINDKGTAGVVDGKTMTDMVLNSDDKDFAAMDLVIENDPELKAIAEKRKNTIKQDAAIIKQLKEAGITDDESIKKLTELEKSKEALEGNATRAGKKKLKEIDDKIDAIMDGVDAEITETTDADGNTITEAVVVTEEYATEKLKEDGIENPTDEQVEVMQAEIMQEGRELIKKEQDAIQKPSTEKVDVQEPTESSKRLGE